MNAIEKLAGQEVVICETVKTKDGWWEIQDTKEKGKFLAFGVHDGDSHGSTTTALILMPNGTIRNVFVEHIRFLYVDDIHFLIENKEK